MKSYWQLNVFGDPFVRKIMSSGDRFHPIQSNLHWFGASDMTQNEKRQ
jgi:hypothetical protein